MNIPQSTVKTIIRLLEQSSVYLDILNVRNNSAIKNTVRQNTVLAKNLTNLLNQIKCITK